MARALLAMLAGLAAARCDVAEVARGLPGVQLLQRSRRLSGAADVESEGTPGDIMAGSSLVSRYPYTVQTGFCRAPGNMTLRGKYCGCYTPQGREACFDRYSSEPWAACVSWNSVDSMCYGYSKTLTEPATCPARCWTKQGTGNVDSYVGNGFPPATANVPQEIDADCALTGFWEFDADVIMRFWKVDYDVGNYQAIGRGRCMDAGGRGFGGWSGSDVDFRTCKEVCDKSDSCVGVEYSENDACVVRYDIGLDLPEDPPSPSLDILDEGDDGTGDVAGTKGPWDSVCFKKTQDGDVPPQAESSTGHWRVAFFPRSGAWAMGGSAAKEAPLTLSASRPADLQACDAVSLDVQGPFAGGLQVWWGTEELSAWAGLPASLPSEIVWRYLPDQTAWDNSVVVGGGRCHIATDVAGLMGQRLSIQHAVWGLRDCKNKVSLRRLSPETAGLDSAGWAQVVADKFRFGMEIFVRRLLADASHAVSDEACFRNFLNGIWVSLSSTSFDALKTKLLGSRCVL